MKGRRQGFPRANRHIFKAVGHGLDAGIRWMGKHFYLASVLFFVASVIFLCSASSWGDRLGNAAGSAVGIAKGSFEGVTEGLKKGAEEGKKTGTSAEDTEVRIGTTLQETQNLQVMQITFHLSDCFKQGDYAALYTIPCTGEFTVNLQQSVATVQDVGRVLITIPKPVFTPYFEEGEVEMEAENKEGKYSGDAEAGYTAFWNSLEKLKTEAEKEITEDDSLMRQAEEAARKQVRELAESVCGTSRAVEVRFLGEGETE